MIVNFSADEISDHIKALSGSRKCAGGTGGFVPRLHNYSGAHDSGSFPKYENLLHVELI
jgi:hypothetical protein